MMRNSPLENVMATRENLGVNVIYWSPHPATHHEVGSAKAGVADPSIQNTMIEVAAIVKHEATRAPAAVAAAATAVA
jgi:hypothetical protein